LMASMSGALTSMVANLTVGKKGYKKVWEEMKEVAPQAQELKAAFLTAVDEDTFAFDAVMDAMKLPRTTEEENKRRDAAIESATREAIEVPFGVLRRCRDALPLVEAVAERGNVNSLSDVGVAALALRAAAGGALLNVLINLPGISDAAYVDRTSGEGVKILEEVKERCHSVVMSVIGKLQESLNRTQQSG